MLIMCVSAGRSVGEIAWRRCEGIQVSVKPKMLRVDCKEKAEMKSALLTAD